jgi:hypothetical protein
MAPAPTDTALIDLVRRITACVTAGQLVAVVPDIRGFYGGRRQHELGEIWLRTWQRVVGDVEPPADPWLP